MVENNNSSASMKKWFLAPAFWITFVLGMLFWLVLSQKYDVFHTGLGVAGCLFIAWFCYDLLYKGSLGATISVLIRFISYFFWLLWQIILSNIHLTRLAFSSIKQQNPQVVRYKTRVKGDLALTLFANSITLTPGTIVVDIEGDDFLIHAIDDDVAGDFTSGDSDMERHVARVFSQQL